MGKVKYRLLLVLVVGLLAGLLPIFCHNRTPQKETPEPAEPDASAGRDE